MNKTIVLQLITLIALSCTSETEDMRQLSRINLSLQSNSEFLELGQVVNIVAQGFDQNDDPVEINDFEWSSSNVEIANVDNNGTVTTLSMGKVNIEASSNEIKAAVELRIWDQSLPEFEIFVSDAGDTENPPFQILRYNGQATEPEVFTTERLDWPQDILFLDDKVLVSNLNSGEITSYDLTTREFTGLFAANISGPTRMKIGPDNRLYVLQWSGNGLVLQFELDGTFNGPFTNVGVNQGIGLDWNQQGHLFVSSFNNSNGFIRRFNQNGQDMGIYIEDDLVGPTDIWFDDDGALLVNDWSAGYVRRFTDSEFDRNLVTGLSQTEGIAILDNGYMLIGDGGTGRVKLFNSDFKFKGDWITSSAISVLTPNAITIRMTNSN